MKRTTNTTKTNKISRRRTGVTSPPTASEVKSNQTSKQVQTNEPITKKIETEIIYIGTDKFVIPLSPPNTPNTPNKEVQFEYEQCNDLPRVVGDRSLIPSAIIATETKVVQENENEGGKIKPESVRVRTLAERKQLVDTVPTGKSLALLKAELLKEKALKKAEKKILRKQPKIIIKPIKFPLINQKEVDTTTKDKVTEPIAVTPPNPVEILEVRTIAQAKASVETQTESQNMPIRVTIGTQTLNDTNITKKEISTQTEMIVPGKTDSSTQTEEETQSQPISMVQKVECASQTDDKGDYLMASNGIEYLPYQPRGLTGTLIGQHIVFYKYFEAIEVVDIVGPPKPRVFPTHWISISSTYFDQARSPSVLARIGGNGEITSHHDYEKISVRVLPNGRILATRNGATVVIKYPDGSTGGFRQYRKFEIISSKPGPKQHCVPTEYIARDCPYWHNIMGTNIFPKGQGYSKRIRSPDDGQLIMLHVEINGRVDVSRDNVRVRVREGENTN